MKPTAVHLLERRMWAVRHFNDNFRNTVYADIYTNAFFTKLEGIVPRGTGCRSNFTHVRLRPEHDHG